MLKRLGFLLYWLGNSLAVLLGLLGLAALIFGTDADAIIISVLLFGVAGFYWLVLWAFRGSRQGKG